MHVSLFEGLELQLVVPFAEPRHVYVIKSPEIGCRVRFIGLQDLTYDNEPLWDSQPVVNLECLQRDALVVNLEYRGIQEEK